MLQFAAMWRREVALPSAGLFYGISLVPYGLVPYKCVSGGQAALGGHMGAFPSVGLCYSLWMSGALRQRFHRSDYATIYSYLVPYGRVSVSQAALRDRMGAFPSARLLSGVIWMRFRRGGIMPHSWYRMDTMPSVRVLLI